MAESVSGRLHFVIHTPSDFLSVEERLNEVVREMNSVLNNLTTVLRDMTGEAGAGSPTFYGNLHLQGNRVLEHGTPVNSTDGVNKAYVDGLMTATNSSIARLSYRLEGIIGSILRRITVTGVQNGVNLAFALASTPLSSGPVILFFNGVFLDEVSAAPGVRAYTRSGTSLTLGLAPVAADTLYAYGSIA